MGSHLRSQRCLLINENTLDIVFTYINSYYVGYSYKVMASNICRSLDELRLESVSDEESDSIFDKEYPNPLRIEKEYEKANIRLWPKGEVFYVFDDNVSYPLRQSIQKAVESFSAKTPVLWTPRTHQPYYVKFVETPETSSSSVGCKFVPKQEIKISTNARYGTIIHEMCHALGMKHEHSRADRDSYVDCYKIVREKGIIKRYDDPQDTNYKKQETPPLGKYDFDSVMHYSGTDSDDNSDGIKLQTRNRLYRHKIGQRKDFSEKDLEKIDILYGSKVCTFERFGEQYRPVQWYFRCLTCWGQVSKYGCCLYCAFNCHSPNGCKLKRYRIKSDSKAKFVCDCGRNSHAFPMCTLLSTGAKNVKQVLYYCYDCFDNPLQRCCYACSKKCHESHNLSTKPATYSRCDCGIEFSCKFSSEMERLCTEKLCTFDRFKEMYRSCVYYQCYTCWEDDSNYGCCTYCANNHHIGHSLYETSSSRFVCDCGRNGHKTPMCTLLSTGPKPVKQNWYHCIECFRDPTLGCCYACYTTCHKFHLAYKMGNAT